MPDEPTRIGPHLLGRKPNKPDDRDWTPEKLHAKLGEKHEDKPATTGSPDEALLDKTFRQALEEESPFVTTWRGLLILWGWLKRHFHPSPKPTPSPTDVPAWEDLVVLDQGNYGTCVG